MTSPVGSTFQPGYLCVSDPASKEYSFCAPNPVLEKPGKFYEIVPANSPENVIKSITSRFSAIFLPAQKGELKPETTIPNGVTLDQGKLLVDVTEILPAIVKDRAYGPEDYPGPNCYWAALAASGILTGPPRYVDGLEFRYYLTKFFKPVSTKPMESSKLAEAALPFGALLVFIKEVSGVGFNKRVIPGDLADYENNPIRQISRFVRRFGFTGEEEKLLEDGTHSAFILQSGMVFHKAGPYQSDDYQVVPAVDSMYQADLADFLKKDKFERLGKLGPERKNYVTFGYIRRETPFFPFPITHVNQERFNYYKTLFDYYNSLLETAKDIGRTDFEKNRFDLMTIENVWELKRRFEREFLNEGSIAILKVDPKLVEIYLKLYSLSWQYQAMTDVYTRSVRREGNILEMDKYLQWLYNEHYTKSLDTDGVMFDRELSAHLAARNIHPARWAKVKEVVTTEVRKKAAGVKVAHSEGRGVDLFKIIDDIIQEQNSTQMRLK